MQPGVIGLRCELLKTLGRQGLRSICRGQAWSAGPGSGQAIQVPWSAGGSGKCFPLASSPEIPAFPIDGGVYHAGLELSGVACRAREVLLLLASSLPELPLGHQQ